MDSEIYYFTGTGNTRAVAKDIAGNTGSTLIAIKDVLKIEIGSDFWK